MLPHFYDAMAPSLAEEDLNANFTREAGSFENIAVNSILRGSQWTETFKAPVPPSQHINVKEARALTTAVSRECTQLLGGKPGGFRRRDSYTCQIALSCGALSVRVGRARWP